MDQHQYLNEQCIAVQCWNGFSREQQKDAAMWHKAKEMAKKIKISRENASGVPEEEDLRGISPCTVRSFGRGQSRGPSSSHAATVAEKAAPLEEVTKSKKTHGKEVCGSRRRTRRGKPEDSSQDSSSRSRRRTRRRIPQHVTINFR